MKPILTAFFKEKILTVQYQDLSFTDYYLDGVTWRRMPGMKTVTPAQLTEVYVAMEIVSKKRIANAKRRETRKNKARGMLSVSKDGHMQYTSIQPDEQVPWSHKGLINDDSRGTEKNLISRLGGWVRSLFTMQ
jgi:hypothetical protein